MSDPNEALQAEVRDLAAWGEASDGKRLDMWWAERAARLKAEAERDALRDNPGRATKQAILNVLGDAADSLKSRAELREALALLSKAREAVAKLDTAWGCADAAPRLADLAKILGTEPPASG